MNFPIRLVREAYSQHGVAMASSTSAAAAGPGAGTDTNGLKHRGNAGAAPDGSKSGDAAGHVREPCVDVAAPTAGPHSRNHTTVPLILQIVRCWGCNTALSFSGQSKYVSCPICGSYIEVHISPVSFCPFVVLSFVVALTCSW